MKNLSISSYPRAIIHIDGDAFFVSCEQVVKPNLKGKPVVTGAERGIVSAASYEAKGKGIKRAMTIPEAKKLCPDLVVLPSNYELYSLFSERMYAILRHFTPEVEEYSIDECFGDLTGLRRASRMNYEEMAGAVKKELKLELDVNFSVGLGPNKVISKIASKWGKPDGLVFIPGKEIHRYLKDLPAEKVWGIGPNTSAYLQKLGVKSALEFARKPEWWVKKHFTKPIREIWKELRGEYVLKVEKGGRESYKSIQKTKTFKPSREKEYVFAELSKNVENACIKARRYGLSSDKVSFFLKTRDFHYRGLKLGLSFKTNSPNLIIDVIERHFERIFERGKLYRSTGVTLHELLGEKGFQHDLFGGTLKVKDVSEIFKKVDELSKKYGKHTVYLGSSHEVHQKTRRKDLRKEKPERNKKLLKGETERKRLNIPFLGETK